MRNALVLLEQPQAVTDRLVTDGFTAVDTAATSALNLLVCELVNPASSSFVGTDPGIWLATVRNCTAMPFQQAQRSLPRLKLGNDARIIFVFDGWRAAAEEKSTASAAANGAIVSLVKTLARDLGSEGITVNAIARARHAVSGPNSTGLTGAVAYLASPLAGALTGQILNLGTGGEIRP